MRIEYEGGYFDIPKLNIKMGGTNKDTIPTTADYNLIKSNAIKLSINYPQETLYSAAQRTDNILQTLEPTPKNTGMHRVTKAYIYKLKNGAVLCLGCVGNYSESGGSRYTSVFSVGMLFTEPMKIQPFQELSWYTKYLRTTTWSSDPAPEVYFWGDYDHNIYMFEDIDGNLVTGVINRAGRSSNYPILPGTVEKDSNLYNALFAPPQAPKFEDDENDTGGGEGEYTFKSESVPVSPLPIKSAADTGFITLYNPTNEQLKNLANYLWTSDFTTAIKKMFNDPMDAILGLSFAPVKPEISNVKEISVGFIPTGVSMNVVANQYIQFDCGSININEQWGSCLDYSPFTKVSIYLPYIGEKPLDIDDVMNTTLHLYYNIDLLSGSCVAQLLTAPKDKPERVLYSFAGVCTTSLPITGRDFSALVNSGLQLVTAGATAAISGGVGASAVSSLLINSASNITSAKPNIQKTSAIASSSGLLSIQTPYLIFSYPRQSLPINYRVYQGYPSNITATLKDLTGYTVVEQIHIENIPATETEKDQIESLLKGGVII